MPEDKFILLSVLEFQDVLDEIVTIRILNEVMQVLNDIVTKLQLLLARSFLKASLHDAAPMLVHTNGYTVRNAGIEDKVGVLGGLLGSCDVLVLRSVGCLELDQESLDDMIAVHVANQINNIIF